VGRNQKIAYFELWTKIRKSYILGYEQKSENRIFLGVDKNHKITYFGLWIKIIKSHILG
jgi:hypothetical protein